MSTSAPSVNSLVNNFYNLALAPAAILNQANHLPRSIRNQTDLFLHVGAAPQGVTGSASEVNPSTLSRIVAKGHEFGLSAVGSNLNRTMTRGIDALVGNAAHVPDLTAALSTETPLVNRFAAPTVEADNAELSDSGANFRESYGVLGMAAMAFAGPILCLNAIWALPGALAGAAVGSAFAAVKKDWMQVADKASVGAGIGAGVGVTLGLFGLNNRFVHQLAVPYAPISDLYNNIARATRMQYVWGLGSGLAQGIAASAVGRVAGRVVRPLVHSWPALRIAQAGHGVRHGVLAAWSQTAGRLGLTLAGVGLPMLAPMAVVFAARFAVPAKDVCLYTSAAVIGCAAELAMSARRGLANRFAAEPVLVGERPVVSLSTDDGVVA